MLKKDIQFSIDPDTNQEVASIRIGSIAWNQLCKNAAEGNFDDQVHDDLQEMVKQQMTTNPLVRTVHVSSEIGRALETAILNPLNQIEKNFVDMRRTAVRIIPASGKGWVSPDTLVGQAASQNPADHGTFLLSESEMYTPHSAMVKIEFKIISF
jgi:hypothetical protein